MTGRDAHRAEPRPIGADLRGTGRARRAAIVVAALVLPVAAQVPDGWFVASSLRTATLPTTQNPWPGLGGLFFVHPRDAAVAPVAVTGLPTSLTGAGGMPEVAGANCVARRFRDGALVVGEIQPVGATAVRIHLITLNGNQVANDVPFSIGSATGSGASTNFGAIDQLAILPNETVLFTLRGITPVMPNIGSLAILDTVNGVVAPVITGGTVTGVVNALAANFAGTTAYFATFNPAMIMSTIFRVTLPSGSPASVANINGVVTALAVDNAGQIVATTLGMDNNGAVPNVLRVDPASGTVAPLTTAAFARNAIAVERATGNFAITRQSFSNLTMAVSWMTPSGTETVLTTGPAGGWGVVTGLDVNPDPEPFGAPTFPGATSYFWAVAPNPGGLPLRGNSQFSLTLVSSPAGRPGFWGMSRAWPGSRRRRASRESSSTSIPSSLRRWGR